jgi:uncharacterized protein
MADAPNSSTSATRNFDTLAPEFSVKVDHTDLPPEIKADLIAVTVVEDIGAPGMFTFSLNSWDGVQMRVKWIDDERFREGKAVELTVGYRDRQSFSFKGEITGLEPSFSNDAPAILTVRGYDRSHRLMRQRKTRSFTQMKDSEIASQIAGDVSLTPDVQNSQVTHAYVLQNNQTDLEFLQERARKIGFEVNVIDTTLRFRERPTGDAEIITLRREADLLEFHPRLSTVGQFSEVVVRGWNPKDKREFVGRSRVGDETSMNRDGGVTGPAASRQAFGQSGNVAVDWPVRSQEEADQIAKEKFEEMTLSHVTGYGLCIGQPAIHAGKVVKIEGIGTRFSGRYYVTSTEHTFRPQTGYRTGFTVMRNAS